MYEQDIDKANQIQSDVLIETTANNPNFKTSKVASKNTALKTSDKRVVGAVNELADKQDTIQLSVKNSINKQFEIIGDVISKPKLADNLKAVSDNLINAVIKCDNNITLIKKDAATIEKQICFVVPRVNKTTKSPEIYFPFYGTLNRIVASVSSQCANRSEEDAAIPLSLQYRFDNEWRNLADVTIDKDNFYAQKNFNDETLIVDNKPMRIKINNIPESGETYDLSVIVFMKVAR